MFGLKLKIYDAVVNENETKQQKKRKNIRTARAARIWAYLFAISTSEFFSWLRERRGLGNPEAKCLLIGFREEQSKESLIGAFMFAQGVSRRSKVQIANFRLWEPYGACSPT